MLLSLLMSPVVSRVMPYVAAAIVAAGAYWWVTNGAYQRGAAATTARYEALFEAERERVKSANAEALQRAQELEAALIATKEERDELVRQASIEAAQDADAARTAIGAASVRRLNRVVGDSRAE